MWFTQGHRLSGFLGLEEVCGRRSLVSDVHHRKVIPQNYIRPSVRPPSLFALKEGTYCSTFNSVEIMPSTRCHQESRHTVSRLGHRVLVYKTVLPPTQTSLGTGFNGLVIMLQVLKKKSTSRGKRSTCAKNISG